MPRSNETRLTLQAPLAVVLAVMTDPEFNRARDEAQGTFDVRITELSRSESALTYRVDGKSYAQGLRGVDQSKVESSVTTYQWDLTNARATWAYEGPHGHRVKVSGTIVLTPQGDIVVVEESLSVAISIPLIGGQVEKLVIKEMKTGFETYARVLREHVSAALH